MYGSLDMLVVGSYLKTLANDHPNIKVHKIVTGHAITTKYAQKLVKILADIDKQHIAVNRS